ncbi:hypothetical protein KUH03_17155 [Sphingobacterium sp. E70]|uniref:hypothetical protein n=1 Tax=Sphingobacterium sp. E70 TaxID=2853439 RepID=UPI00211BA647|nr:hypothetical protein [Sphingobacterium sp. E70]ULT28166.1 hypothetical protein KUH03_17155 [Sphingobacterium sp. E70]
MNLQNQPFDNRAALRYINMGKDISVYQLQGDGKIDLNNKDKLSYRMNFDYYQDQRTFNLYDTYLDYDTEKWGVKLGNIYENLDQFINGRGVKGTYKFDKRRSLSLYAIQNNYMLFTEMDNPIPGGEIVGVKYAIQTEKIRKTASLTYIAIMIIVVCAAVCSVVKVLLIWDIIIVFSWKEGQVSNRLKAEIIG